MIYTVTLNPAVDYVVSLDALETGAINRAASENVVFGGKGINVSLMLRALETPSAALGFIAGFTGEAIRAGVEVQGVRTDFVALESGFSRINVKLHAGEETEINGAGPEIPPEKLCRTARSSSSRTGKSLRRCLTRLPARTRPCSRLPSACRRREHAMCSSPWPETARCSARNRARCTACPRRKVQL